MNRIQKRRQMHHRNKSFSVEVSAEHRTPTKANDTDNDSQWVNGSSVAIRSARQTMGMRKSKRKCVIKKMENTFAAIPVDRCVHCFSARPGATEFANEPQLISHVFSTQILVSPGILGFKRFFPACNSIFNRWNTLHRRFTPFAGHFFSSKMNF